MFPRKFGLRAESLIALRRTLRTELIRFLAPGNLEVFAVLAVSCFVTGNFGDQLAVFHGSVTAIWPPTGIALAAVLLKGRRVWQGIYLGAFLVHLKLTGSLSNSRGMATLNTLEALTAAHLVNTFASGTNALSALRFCPLEAAGTALLMGGFAIWVPSMDMVPLETPPPRHCSSLVMSWSPAQRPSQLLRPIFNRSWQYKTRSACTTFKRN
jgi:hypothetical protein